MRFFKSKMLLILAFLTLVVYLSNDFTLIDIKETAIIIALAIDREGEEFEVSAQIAVPQTTDQTASSSAAVISGKGETIALAIEDIGTHTGWYPKLSFCNLILLGENMLSGDIMESLDYFIRTIKIQDTAELCATQKKAKDVLTATNPLDDFSAFSITKIMEKDTQASPTVIVQSLKDFAIGYYSKSGLSMMPMIKMMSSGGGSTGGGNSGESGNAMKELGGALPAQGQADEAYSISGGAIPAQGQADEAYSVSGGAIPAQGSGGGGSGGADGSGGNSGSKEEKIYDATTTLLFSKGKCMAELSSDETLILNLLLYRVNTTYIELNGTEYCGEKANMYLALRENTGKFRLRMEGGRPNLDIGLEFYVKIEDTNVTVSPSELSDGYIVPANILRDVESYVAEYIERIFEKAREADCDVFNVRDRLFRTQNAYYPALKNIVLKETKLNVSVKAKSFQ